jgi:hypothetical protein
VEEAKKAHPDVPMRDNGSVNVKSTARVPDCPPADFDPMDAGERW